MTAKKIIFLPFFLFFLSSDFALSSAGEDEFPEPVQRCKGFMKYWKLKTRTIPNVIEPQRESDATGDAAIADDNITPKALIKRTFITLHTGLQSNEDLKKLLDRILYWYKTGNLKTYCTFAQRTHTFIFQPYEGKLTVTEKNKYIFLNTLDEIFKNKQVESISPAIDAIEAYTFDDPHVLQLFRHALLGSLLVPISTTVEGRKWNLAMTEDFVQQLPALFVDSARVSFFSIGSFASQLKPAIETILRTSASTTEETSSEPDANDDGEKAAASADAAPLSDSE